MIIPQLYMYDLKTGEYTGSRDATQRPNGEYILEATGATPVALPAVIPAGHIARWTGEAWETVELNILSNQIENKQPLKLL